MVNHSEGLVVKKFSVTSFSLFHYMIKCYTTTYIFTITLLVQYDKFFLLEQLLTNNVF